MMSDLYKPQRLSYLAVVYFIYRFVVRGVRAAWPMLIYAISRYKSIDKFTVIIGLIILIVLLVIFAFLHHHMRHYYITDTAFIYKKGVIKKKIIEIPFDRIQAVNLEQDIILQIFDNVRVKLETAGSSQEEVSLAAITQKRASELVKELEAKRLTSKANYIEETADDDQPVELESPFHPIFRASIPQLFQAGISMNHFRTLALMIAAIIGPLEQIEQYFEQYINQVSDNIEEVASESSFLFLAGFALLFFVLLMLASGVYYIIKYFDFTMYQNDQSFKLSYGLFNRKETIIKFSKVQTITERKSILHRLLGFSEITISQASSKALGQKLKLPVVNQELLTTIHDTLYADIGRNQKQFIKSHLRYFLIRFWSIAAIFLLCYAGLSYKNQNLYEWAPLLLTIPIIGIFQWRYVKELWLEYSDDMFVFQKGVFTKYRTWIAAHKVQQMSVRKSPYQRRNALSNLTLFTSSNKHSFPYMSWPKAKAIVDRSLYQLAAFSKPWM